MNSVKKLIRKFNFVDYLFLFFLFAAAAIFYLMFFRKATYLAAVIKVTDRNVLYALSTPPYWYSSLFKKGMEEKDALGRPTAEVLGVYSYDTSPTTKAVYLTIRLRTVYSRRNEEYKYKGITVVVGESLRINFKGLLVEGLVTEVEGMKNVFPEKTLLVKTKLNSRDPVYREVQGVEPYVADSIKLGDGVKDSTGNTVAELVDKKVVPAKRYTFDSFGNVYQKNDPNFQEVSLVFKIKVKDVNGRMFFLDDIPVAVPGTLPIHFNDVSIFPTIISFEEVKE